MFFRRKKSGNNEYLQIVENRWEGGRSKQHVIVTLGRMDELEASGQLDRLLASGARFAESIMVIDAHMKGELPSVGTQRVGPVLIFERLWKESGIRAVINGLLAGRNFEFPVERAIFLTVLRRLFGGGSDRFCEMWAADYGIEGIDGLDLHHLYRAMAWLGEELPESEQGGHTFSPRCTKDLIEEELFFRSRDLFSSLDLVFFDTTSIYFEGEGGETLGKRGHTKDHRPDLKQMVVGAVIDNEGRPICCEMWPGNTADVTSLIPVVDRLRSRFAIGRVCIVADRGMISADTLEELEKRQWPYILGARMRKQKEVKEDVLSRAGRYQAVKTDGAPLKVKEVRVEDRRYVVCVNEEQAKKDAESRPVFHKYDRTIRGHVFCSFLALVLRRALQDRLDAKGHSLEWTDILLSLDSLTETELRHQGKRFILRSDPKPTCTHVFHAVGVALPPQVRRLTPESVE